MASELLADTKVLLSTFLTAFLNPYAV